MGVRPRFWKRTRNPPPQESDPNSSTEPIVLRGSEHDPQPEAVADPPREWNLWELERVARDHTSDDLAKNDERAYLLIYLREFAGPDGNLPADFDGLVRDAFGDLVHVVAT